MAHPTARRTLIRLLICLPIALSVLVGTAAIATPRASAGVIWDDPLTTTVEKRPKVKISKAEYRQLTKGMTYAKVKKIADGKGSYFGSCVEGGPCGKNVRWYLWRYRNGKVKYDGKWYGRWAVLGFKDGKLARKYHN